MRHKNKLIFLVFSLLPFISFAKQAPKDFSLKEKCHNDYYYQGKSQFCLNLNPSQEVYHYCKEHFSNKNYQLHCMYAMIKLESNDEAFQHCKELKKNKVKKNKIADFQKIPFFVCSTQKTPIEREIYLQDFFVSKELKKFKRKLVKTKRHPDYIDSKLKSKTRSLKKMIYAKAMTEMHFKLKDHPESFSPQEKELIEKRISYLKELLYDLI